MPSLWKKFKTWRSRCHTCETDGIDGSLLGGFPELGPVERLKSGQLYRCSKCGGAWFLDAERRWLLRIKDDELPLLRRWNQESFLLPDAVLNVFSEIGGVLNHGRDVIGVPCSARTTSGRHHVKAMVLVSKQPPSRCAPPTTWHAASELASVTPSPFALPLDIRRASSEKTEESMGFAPVGVVDSRGREYTLAGETDFFDKDGAKGEEMRLSGRTSRWPNVVQPEAVDAVYFADWFEGCEATLLGHPLVR